MQFFNLNIFRLDNSDDLVNEVEEEEMPEETEEEYQTKQAVLKASLPFVHQYGWTKKAIVAGLLFAINSCLCIPCNMKGLSKNMNIK